MSAIYLDLETASADEIWTYGPGFVRLAGYAVDNGPIVTTTDIPSLIDEIHDCDIVVAHNGLAFDLPALALEYDLDIGRMVEERRIVDTLIVARQNDPRLSDKSDARRYGLNAVAQRVGEEGKLVHDGEAMLDSLVRAFGGYDRIPTDDPQYNAYLRQDVETLRKIAAHLIVDEYCWREHQVMWRLGHINSQGFRVDVTEATRLIAAQNERIDAAKHRLHQSYGLPLEGKKPQATKTGKTALEQAFKECGIAPPRTAKGGLATGRAALDAVVAEHPDNTELAELCEVLRALNGERSTAQTILACTRSDGRVHPEVDARQATGRISVTKPGLTTSGKRDRRNVTERSLLLPDEGDVLITVDLSQIDARAMAMHSQDPEYISVFEPGRDFHSEMAAALFGRGEWDGTGHHPRRGDAKPVTHATTYGMGASTLAANAGLTDDEAHRLLATLDMRFPRLAAFKEQIRDQARREQVITNALGRTMRVRPGREYTQAPAFIGQGTARDLMMEGVLRLPEWLVPRLRAIVHDELVLSVPTDCAEDALEQVLDALQFGPVCLKQHGPTAIGVDVLADSGDIGRDWADCYRSEKAEWPEVSRSHREMTTCDDKECTWHLTDTANHKEDPHV